MPAVNELERQSETTLLRASVRAAVGCPLSIPNAEQSPNTAAAVSISAREIFIPLAGDNFFEAPLDADA